MADYNVDTPFKGHADYLAKRGIDEVTRERLRIVSCGAKKLRDLGFKYPEQWNPQSAILIPANSITGEQLGCGARVFYQKTFGEDSRAKYLSLPGDGKKPPNLHFSPLARWNKLEYGQRIFICESYIKANILCKLGFHAIGVSGVNGWSFQRDLHRDLADIDWRGQGLKPVAFMDSNVHEGRADLWLAIKKMQAAMESRCGVDLRVLKLPAPDDDTDWGLDDYAMHHGEAKLAELLEGEVESIPSELGAHLMQMNNEVCYVHQIGKFVDIERNNFMGRGQFEDMAFATRSAFNLEEKVTPVAKVWTKWDGRNEVDHLKYKPGQERIVRNDTDNYFNEWRGWGCEPLAGDVGLFTDWLEDALTDSVEREYFTQWWAYQLQHPGIKLNTALMLIGSSGVGKGWMAGIAEQIFGGANTWKCNLSDLESRFNSGVGASQLMVVEEADISGGMRVYNVLKDLITNEHVRLERKGIDAIKIDNCTNIFMSSNHIDVLELDEFDRRFAIFEITAASFANDPTYWDPRFKWVEEEGGAAMIMGWLLNYDISDFNPKGEAPWSQAKKDMVELTHDPIDTFVAEYVKPGNEQLNVAGVDIDGRLMTAKELAWCYLEGQVLMCDISKSLATKMNKALKAARVPVANAGGKVKFHGVSSRFFILNGPEYSESWGNEVASRTFWSESVASNATSVANEVGAGNQKSKW